jgi:hypothetical protein
MEILTAIALASHLYSQPVRHDYLPFKPKQFICRSYLIREILPDKMVRLLEAIMCREDKILYIKDPDTHIKFRHNMIILTWRF